MPGEKPSQVVVPEQWEICTVDLHAHDGPTLEIMKRATEKVLRDIPGTRLADYHPRLVVMVMRGTGEIPPSFALTLEQLRKNYQAVVSFGENV